MSYTGAAVLAVAVSALLDLVVLRTRVLLTLRWWLSYAIILVFQLITNGWLTGRGIVRYAPGAIIGGSRIQLFGDGRVVYAPVEDLGFGFALVLLTIVTWSLLKARAARRSRDGSGAAPSGRRRR